MVPGSEPGDTPVTQPAPHALSLALLESSGSCGLQAGGAWWDRVPGPVNYRGLGTAEPGQCGPRSDLRPWGAHRGRLVQGRQSFSGGSSAGAAVRSPAPRAREARAAPVRSGSAGRSRSPSTPRGAMRGTKAKPSVSRAARRPRPHHPQTSNKHAENECPHGVSARVRGHRSLLRVSRAFAVQPGSGAASATP